MYYAETYTTENASNMTVTTYDDIPMDQIANDLLENVKNWDYAIVSNENDEIICNIFKDGNGYVIDWD